jgi:hypothetical protein
MEKFSIFLEKVENKCNARETSFVYDGESLFLCAVMWNERVISPKYIYNGHAEVRLVLDRENTKKFLDAVGCGESASTEEVVRVLKRDFSGIPPEGHFFDSLSAKIENIIRRGEEGRQKESAYKRAAEENELPNYKELTNPSHKFEVFCLARGIEFAIKEKGSGDYYEE